MARSVTYTVRTVQRADEHYRDGTLAHATGTVIYLDYDDGGGGYPQWRTIMPRQTPWKSAAEAIKTAKAMDGKPWWNRPDMKALKAVRLSITSDFTAEDVE